MTTISALQEAMPPDERQAWIDRFQQLATRRPDEVGDEWESVLQLLELPLDCFLAVKQVLQQGRWAKAKDPRAYVKRAAAIEARKMDPGVPPKNEPLFFMAGEVMNESDGEPESIGAALRKDCRERGEAPPPPMKGRHRTLEQIDWHGEHRDKEQEAAASRTDIPDGFWAGCDVRVRVDGQLISVRYPRRNWGKLTREARLDSGQLEVIGYRLIGMGRDAALREQPDEDSRKALQAAWKRFDRTGMRKIEEFLKKSSTSVPDEQSQDTRKIGAAQSESLRALRAAFERTGKNRMDLGRVLYSYRATLGVQAPVFIRSSSEK